MTGTTEWPARDQAWASRYHAALCRLDVPAASRDERVSELRNAAARAGVCAAELFGDADALAAEDAAERSSTEEAVRRSLGGGLRPVLLEAGGTLLGVGAVAALIIAVRDGWFADIDIAHVLVAAGLLIVCAGWIVARAVFSAGRPAPAIGALAGAAAVCAAALAAAVHIGPGHRAATDVPVVLLAAVVLAPGVALLVGAHRLRQPQLRTDWSDDAWLRRFRGGLLTRLVPAAAAREHVSEIEQSLGFGTTAHAEFGHPVVLAREIAAADRIARVRRWRSSVVLGVGAPLLMAALILLSWIWGAWSIPAAAVPAAAALVALRALRGARPGAQRR